MNKELIVYCCGLHSLALAFLHLFFWRLFRWKTGLQKTGRINRGILQVANVQLILFFFLIAYICFACTRDLYETDLGKVVLTGMAIFWFVRLVQQFVFFRINHPLVHLLTLLFIAGTVLFMLPLV